MPGTEATDVQDTAEAPPAETPEGTKAKKDKPPKPPKQPKPPGPGAARRLVGLFSNQRRAVLGATLLSLVAAVANLSGPYLLGLATDVISAGMIGKRYPAGSTKEQVIADLQAKGDVQLANVFSTMDLVPGKGVDFGKLTILLSVTLVAFVLASICLWMQGRVIALTVQNVLHDIRERVNAKLSRLPISYYDRTPAGEVLTRVTTDVDNLQQTLQLSLGQAVNMMFGALSVLAVMFVLSPTLALLVLITVPLALVMWLFVGVKAGMQYTKQWSTTGAVTARVEEVYALHSLVRSFRRQSHVQTQFERENDALAETERSAQAVTGVIEPVTRFLTDLSYVLVAVFGALRVASGTLSIGEVVAFTQYAGMFTRPIVLLAGISGQAQSGLASARRIFELLDAEEQPADIAQPTRPEVVRGRVEFEKVGFSYAPEVPLMRELSLIVEPGTVVAVVGPTGAGKTTLGNLLMRFYEVNNGRVLLDGVDITAMDRNDLRGHIGIVPQEPWLFNGTIADNIAYGLPHATREQVVTAARATGVERFVQGLPDGYDTRLDDESSTVSAGEKQLITLARAYLKPASVLILDEATSSIDTRTEASIQLAMNTLRSGRTTFVIAHRLSTIRTADIILVMEKGAIVEWGTHDELVAYGGLYAGLHEGSRTEN